MARDSTGRLNVWNVWNVWNYLGPERLFGRVLPLNIEP